MNAMFAPDGSGGASRQETARRPLRSGSRRMKAAVVCALFAAAGFPAAGGDQLDCGLRQDRMDLRLENTRLREPLASEDVQDILRVATNAPTAVRRPVPVRAGPVRPLISPRKRQRAVAVSP